MGGWGEARRGSGREKDGKLLGLREECGRKGGAEQVIIVGVFKDVLTALSFSSANAFRGLPLRAPLGG